MFSAGESGIARDGADGEKRSGGVRIGVEAGKLFFEAGAEQLFLGGIGVSGEDEAEGMREACITEGRGAERARGEGTGGLNEGRVVERGQRM